MSRAELSDNQTVTADPAQAVRDLVQQMAGRRLPSERDLSARLQISRPRLRAILADLRAEGLTEPRPGSGTYAVDQQEGRLRRVVLLIDDGLKLGDDPFFTYLLEGLQQQIQQAGARCLIERANGQDAWPPLEDGALTLGLAGQALLEGRRPGGPPLVGLLLGPDSRASRGVSVFQLEDRGAGADAARRLLDAGCRDLVFVGREDITASRERFRGAESAVGPVGARLQFVECHLNYAAGLKLARTMKMPPGAGRIGLIATNDWLAVGLHAGLAARPLTHDVRVVSFDGLPLTNAPESGIASLAVPLADIAQDAVAELRRLHRSPASVGRVIRYPLTWADEEPSPSVS